MNVESKYASPDKVWCGLDVHIWMVLLVGFLTVFLLLVVLDMVHPNIFSKIIMSVNVKPVEVKHDYNPVDV